MKMESGAAEPAAAAMEAESRPDPPLRTAYMLQNVGVDLSAEVGQMMLIGSTVRGLQEEGHQVDLMMLNGRDVFVYPDLDQIKRRMPLPQGISGRRWFRLLESGVRRLQSRLKLPYLALFDSLRFYETAVRAIPDYDIVHEYAGLLSVGSALACRRRRKPFVLTVDADIILESAVMGSPLRGVRKWLARRLAAWNYRVADRIIVVSRNTKQHLVANWNVPEAKITVIPNGVDADKFQRTTDPQATRRRWGLEAGPLLMFVGGFQRWHGIDRLLDSVHQLAPSWPDLHLMLVGDGPARRLCEEKIAELQLQQRVTISGLVPHDDVPALLEIADIVTMPYPPLPQEMWFSPLKLYEYMAAGKAIVASGVGQIGEVLTDGENGILVPPGDVTALTAALHDLLQQPDKRRRLGARARRDALQKHTWRRQIQRLESVYRELTARAVNEGRG